MPDFVHDIPIDRWGDATWNAPIDEDLFDYNSPVKNAWGKSSMIGAVRPRREVVFYGELLLVPHLDSLDPDSALLGTGPITVTLTGNFSLGDVAYWNSVTLPTTYIDNATLEVSVSSGLLSSLGCAAIAVANQAGAWSNALAFHVQEYTGTPIY